MAKCEICRRFTRLDALLGNGYRQGQMIEFVGESGSGKTQVSFPVMTTSYAWRSTLCVEQLSSLTRIMHRFACWQQRPMRQPVCRCHTLTLGMASAPIALRTSSRRCQLHSG
jgi:predicted ATP-dependent serine protease